MITELAMSDGTKEKMLLLSLIGFSVLAIVLMLLVNISINLFWAGVYITISLLFSGKIMTWYAMSSKGKGQWLFDKVQTKWFGEELGLKKRIALVWGICTFFAFLAMVIAFLYME
jgi:hypothetical protein